MANNSPWTEKVDGNTITKINFCHRPWTEMHIEENGNITPCCVMPSNIHFVANGIENYQKSDKLKEIKNIFLKINSTHTVNFVGMQSVMGLDHKEIKIKLI